MIEPLMRTLNHRLEQNRLVKLKLMAEKAHLLEQITLIQKQ